MKDNSTKNRKEYVVETLIFFIMMNIWFNNIVFRSFGKWSVSWSKSLFYVVAIAAIGTGIILCYKRTRHRLTAVTTALFPFCIYSYLTYRKTVPLIKIILPVSLIAFVAYAVYLHTRKIENNYYSAEIRKNRIRQSFQVGHTVFTMLMAAFMIRLCCGRLFGNTMISANMEKVKGTDQTYTFDVYRDEIKKFNDSTWYYLSTEEKLDLLQILANIEANHLGLDHELNLGVSNLEKESLHEGQQAIYNNANYAITIDLQKLEEDSVIDIIESVCHEAFHSYEYDLIELYNQADDGHKGLMVFEDVPGYIHDFTTLSNAKVNYDEYYERVSEIKARNYARDRAYFCYYAYAIDFKGEAPVTNGESSSDANDSITVVEKHTYY